MLGAVVFDMDGVIVDSHPAHRSAWREFLRLLGKDVPESELDFIMDGRKRTEILQHFLGSLDAAQLEEYGKMKDELFWRSESAVVPIPGVSGFIDRLHSEGIPIAVATSASRNRTQSTLSRMGILGLFAAVVTGDEVSKGKPDPSIYRVACQRMRCDPQAAVAIEDAASGVRAAKGAGLKCMGIARHQREELLTAAGADAVLKDFVHLTLSQFHSLIGMQVTAALPR